MESSNIAEILQGLAQAQDEAEGEAAALDLENYINQKTSVVEASADTAVTEAALELAESVDSEELDQITEDLTGMTGVANNSLALVDQGFGQLDSMANSALDMFEGVVTDNIDTVTRLTMSAQDVLRMSFEEIEDKLEKAAIKYMKQKALGVAQVEFQEQIDLYYQAKQLYERVSGLKQSAEDVVTTASGTINKTKDTVSKLKTSLMTLQKAVKVVIDLAT